MIIPLSLMSAEINLGQNIDSSSEQALTLLLYEGACDSMGLPEGRFSLNPGETILAKRKRRAFEIINDFLNGAYGASNSFGILSEYAVTSEKDAQTIITFAEQNISDAHSAILLKICQHGLIYFFRTLHIGPAGALPQDDISKKLMESGYDIRQKELPRLGRFYGANQSAIDDAFNALDALALWNANILDVDKLHTFLGYSR